MWVPGQVPASASVLFHQLSMRPVVPGPDTGKLQGPGVPQESDLAHSLLARSGHLQGPEDWCSGGAGPQQAAVLAVIDMLPTQPTIHERATNASHVCWRPFCCHHNTEQSKAFPEPRPVPMRHLGPDGPALCHLPRSGPSFLPQRSVARAPEESSSSFCNWSHHRTDMQISSDFKVLQLIWPGWLSS